MRHTRTRALYFNSDDQIFFQCEANFQSNFSTFVLIHIPRRRQKFKISVYIYGFCSIFSFISHSFLIYFCYCFLFLFFIFRVWRPDIIPFHIIYMKTNLYLLYAYLIIAKWKMWNSFSLNSHFFSLVRFFLLIQL